MKKRLFIAIPLEEKSKQVYINYKKQFEQYRIKWTKIENLHITITFLGEVEQKAIPEIIDKINNVLCKTKFFPLHFEKIMLAPPNKKPSMIWAKFAATKEYKQLSFKLYNAIGKYIQKQNSHKEVMPHVTMARFKNHVQIDHIDITQSQIPDIQVKALHLMESQLNSDGPIYSTVATFALNI